MERSWKAREKLRQLGIDFQQDEQLARKEWIVPSMEDESVQRPQCNSVAEALQVVAATQQAHQQMEGMQGDFMRAFSQLMKMAVDAETAGGDHDEKQPPGRGKPRGKGKRKNVRA
mgnify:CR=1 FL=1